MTNYEFKRMAAAIESFGGGFFQSLVPAFNKADVIYVGGGNTKSMLAVWREWKVDIL